MCDPLSLEELAEAEAEGLIGGEVVKVGVVYYRLDHAPECASCGEHFPLGQETLDEEGYCADCAREATDWVEHCRLESALIHI